MAGRRRRRRRRRRASCALRRGCARRRASMRPCPAISSRGSDNCSGEHAAASGNRDSPRSPWRSYARAGPDAASSMRPRARAGRRRARCACGRAPRPPPLRRPASRSACCGLKTAVETAGNAPNNRPATIDSDEREAEHARIGRDRDPVGQQSRAGTSRAAAERDEQAERATADWRAAPPRSTSWRAMRARPAPSAMRTESSF